MKTRLEEIKKAAEAAVLSSKTQQEIDELRVKYLGKKGELTAILKQMGSLSPEERPIMGQLVNEAKEKVEKLIAERTAVIKQKETELKLKAEALDVTRYD